LIQDAYKEVCQGVARGVLLRNPGIEPSRPSLLYAKGPFNREECIRSISHVELKLCVKKDQFRHRRLRDNGDLLGTDVSLGRPKGDCVVFAWPDDGRSPRRRGGHTMVRVADDAW